MTDTTSGTFIEAVRALPNRFADRLSDTDRRWVESAAEAGEWTEALEQLAAGFVHREATITTVERKELVGLFQTAHADIGVLDEVTTER
jgi:hypothetical protein